MKQLLYLTALGVAGCLSVPGDGPAPMCHQTSDCDEASGEICAEGVCWGDPPAGIYAARIGPPGDRDDLVPTEITSVEIASNGWFTTSLRLEAPVVISGSVTCAPGIDACAGRTAVASTITVTRPARIQGGPPFVAVAHTTADSPDFQIDVPRADAGEDYWVTVMPDRADHELDDIAPARLPLTPTDSVAEVGIELGGLGRTITGTVFAKDGSPLLGARVVARGRWEADGPMTDISSVGTTTTGGMFTLYLPTASFDTEAEVVVTPPDNPNELRPTLIEAVTLAGTQSIALPNALRMPNLGATQLVTIPVTGQSVMGALEQVAGAQVTLIAEKTIQQLPYPPMIARLELTDMTDGSGEVHMQVVPSQADLTYLLHVKPPARSGAAQYATVYGTTLDITAGEPTVPAIHLANQVSVRGVLYDHAGQYAEGVVVTVVPNAGYVSQLDDELQRKVGEVVPTAETTNSNGEFATFVDPEIGATAAEYDVHFEPPQHSLLPSWQQQSVRVDKMTGLDLQSVDLPPAAYVRSLVFDPDDQPIEGAEVRLYEIPAAIVGCGHVVPASPTCSQKAILRAQASSDSGGEVHLVMPDPEVVAQ